MRFAHTVARVLNNAVTLISGANWLHSYGDTRSSTSHFESTSKGGYFEIRAATDDVAHSGSLEVKSVTSGECYP